ncbi:MAG: ClpXP protease specificity-enhancing factor SspB, partial [Pseudomonadota bacterium]|nr:ClpXP protease specificity-enhancing factor SspB [Pseudomonadota bacterium]
MSMTSQKPYLIRAIHEWLLDNQCTPYVLVNTRHEGVQVPQNYVKDGRIVLNIAPDAIRDLTRRLEDAESFIPLVACSSSASSADIITALRAGASDVVLKPCCEDRSALDDVIGK